MTPPKTSPQTRRPNTPLDPHQFPSAAQTESTAGRDKVHEQVHRVNAPRQSNRPAERSSKSHSGG